MRLVADKKLGDLTPQEIAALIDKGLAVPPPKPAEDSEAKKGHNWPPIINLSEAGGYYFATGSAELTPSFATELRTVVVDKLLEIADSYDVDVIEVIGHTDEQPVNGRASNLDRALSSVTSGTSGAGVLQWADNAGLGSRARALGGRAIVGRSAPQDLPHPAALRRPADRHRRPDHPLGQPRRRPRASPDRDQNAKVDLTGAIGWS